MAITTVIGRPDPFTVVVIEGIRLGAYAVGGVNVSVGPLGRVDFAHVLAGKRSGGAFVSGFAYDFVVTSGSGNIVTVTVGIRGTAGSGFGPTAEAPASLQTSSYPLALVAYGH